MFNPGSGRSPAEGNGNPLHYSCLENSMDKKSWADDSPWGHKELDTTEQLNSNKRSILFFTSVTKAVETATEGNAISCSTISSESFKKVVHSHFHLQILKF